jgi:hypothetical protein
MAFEEPQAGIDIELGLDLALVGAAALFGNPGDAVEHQHRRQRQLGVALAEQFAARAGQKPLQVETRFASQHENPTRFLAFGAAARPPSFFRSILTKDRLGSS